MEIKGHFCAVFKNLLERSGAKCIAAGSSGAEGAAAPDENVE
jgi:hypothetical protein